MAEKILVIKHGALGDFILAAGAFRAIRNHHKQARITLMCRKPFAALGEASGYFDDIWIETMPKWRQPLVWLETARKLQDFDRVYDLQNNDRTRIYFSLIPSRKRPQWSGIQSGANLRIIDPGRRRRHAFDKLRDQLAIAGITDIKPDRLDWMAADTDRFGLPEHYALIVPGCSSGHPEKRWSPDRYAQICTFLSKKGVRPVLIGTNDEKSVIDTIRQQVPDALDLCGQTGLYDIPALARRAVAAVGNDTGPVHMIALTGCPVVALYQGEGEKWRKGVIIGDNAHTLHKESMADIAVQDVIDIIEPLLPSPEGGG